MEYKYPKDLRKFYDGRVKGTLIPKIHPGSKLTNMDTKRVVFMTPTRYLSLNMPFEYRIEWDDEHYNQVNMVREKLKKGIPIDPVMMMVDIDSNRVMGQDGVHRALAAKELGIKKIPVYIIYTRRVDDGLSNSFGRPRMDNVKYRKQDSLYGVDTRNMRLSNKILSDDFSSNDFDGNEGFVPLGNEFKQRFKYRIKKLVKPKTKRKCRCK
jgi:hypothetical protein